MTKIDWDSYFQTHYQPEGEEWGKKDLRKYEIWYNSWISHIEMVRGLSFSGKKVLEIGCSIGSVCSLLKKRGADVTGSDIARTMVEHASRVVPNTPFFVYDVMKSFPKKISFDYVMGFEVLEHIPELPKAFENIRKLLKKEGWFIGTTPYPYNKNMIDATHINVHYPQEWKKMFEDHGFIQVTTKPMSFFPLLWRIPPHANPVISTYIPFPGIVSTTLITAQKK